MIPRIAPRIVRDGLTDREHEVLSTYIETGNLQETAGRLGVSRAAVNGALARARQRVGARNTVQLAQRGEFDGIDSKDVL